MPAVRRIATIPASPPRATAAAAARIYHVEFGLKEGILQISRFLRSFFPCLAFPFMEIRMLHCTLLESTSLKGKPARLAGSSAILAFGLLFTACTAPGMKMDVRASNKPSTSTMGDLRVTLHKLDPQVVMAQAVRPLDANLLADLATERPKAYVIGAQDILQVTVWDHPEITQALGQFRSDNSTGTLVDSDGYIYFPYVGRTRVEGLTPNDARIKLTADLAKVLRNPQVDVKVLAYRSQKVYIGGEVKAPATYNVTDVPFTLTEAINRAGGFTPTADDSRMVLARGGRSWVLDFQAIMGRGGLGDKITMKDGDTLMVPNNLENPIYLMGEVNKPGTQPLVHGSISLAKALSDGGGILGASAEARSIYVIRAGEQANAVDVWHLDARNPTAMVLADRFALNPRDIVYVDAGTAVRFNRLMTLLLPTITTVVQGTVGAYEIRYFNRSY